MNPAAEFIIRWHFNQHKLSKSEIDQVITTLKAQLAGNNVSARQLAATLISRALEVVKEPPDDQIIPAIYDIHLEYEALAAADRQLDAQTIARHMYEARVQTPLGGRIAIARIRAMLAEYELELSGD
jgi:hypothetical protein